MLCGHCLKRLLAHDFDSLYKQMFHCSGDHSVRDFSDPTKPRFQLLWGKRMQCGDV